MAVLCGFVSSVREVECYGQRLVRYLSSRESSGYGLEDSASEESLAEVSLDNEEDNFAYLRTLDPKEWKTQDHYAVLGLKNKRHRATFAEIRAAYRLKVLKHHPDKRKAKGEVVNSDDDYFTCITKAWEILGDKLKRRSYDSVDPFFDDSLPSSSGKGNFFEVFGKAFELNSRWSEKQPVPQLGGPDDPREKVDKLYSFWYDFESWREYSYEDEESKDTGQDREERKWIEKQNKAVRAKKKKEEMARIRSLVDMAYSLDPRIVKFKQEDKEKKEAAKRARAEAARARQEELEKEKQEEEERKRKEKEEAEAAEKAKQAALKAEREAYKKALRKEKKTLRDLCKVNNYYSDVDNLVSNMEHSEKMCDVLSLAELEEFNKELKEGGKDVFMKKVNDMESKLVKERQMMGGSNQKEGMVNGVSHTPWTEAQLNLLIKAVNLFPAGTNQRWEAVANFINQHSKDGSDLRSAKEVLSKAKDLQKNEDFNTRLKKAANEKAYQATDKKIEGVETSQRLDAAGAQAWTAEEQSLLEQALKTYPNTTQDRWDQIAACVKTRTKKECMRRYKELVEMVKAKKAVEKGLKAK